MATWRFGLVVGLLMHPFTTQRLFIMSIIEHEQHQAPLELMTIDMGTSHEFSRVLVTLFALMTQVMSHECNESGMHTSVHSSASLHIWDTSTRYQNHVSTHEYSHYSTLKILQARIELIASGQCMNFGFIQP